MHETGISPKTAASVLGVSEASVKRWCDQGVLRTSKTAGGHRKIQITDLMRYLRSQGKEPAAPEVLGFHLGRIPAQIDLEAARDIAVTALSDNDAALFRDLTVKWYLSGRTICEFGDEVLAPAFVEIGDHWHRGEIPIYRERRACEIVLEALRLLETFLPIVGKTASTTLTVALRGDYYALPSRLVSVVLREAGWQATSIGVNLPGETVAQAVRDLRPSLLCVSVSHAESEATLAADMHSVWSACQEIGVPLAVGGRGLTADVRQQLKYTTFCDRLHHLVSFATALLAAHS